MKKGLTLLLITSPLLAMANETFDSDFEINQSNCNLPMHQIRQLLPEKDDQQEALRRCMEKAIKERWTRSNNLDEPST